MSSGPKAAREEEQEERERREVERFRSLDPLQAIDRLKEIRRHVDGLEQTAQLTHSDWKSLERISRLINDLLRENV